MNNSDQDEETVRTMIQRENELINHRVTWLTTVQGLLFAALGFAWDKQRIQPFILLLCFIGLSMSIIAFFALAGATLAMKRLFEWWEKNKPPNYNGPDVMGLQLPKITILRYVGPWSFIPFLFILAWMAVWCIKG